MADSGENPPKMGGANIPSPASETGKIHAPSRHVRPAAFGEQRSSLSQLTIAAATGSRVSRERDATPATGLLCVANFPANTGFAWEFIESLYAGVADRLAERGVQTWVAYPQLGEAPRSLANSAARPVELE